MSWAFWNKIPNRAPYSNLLTYYFINLIKESPILSKFYMNIKSVLFFIFEI